MWSPNRRGRRLSPRPRHPTRPSSPRGCRGTNFSMRTTDTRPRRTGSRSVVARKACTTARYANWTRRQVGDDVTPQVVQRTYVTLVLLQTLAASLIWGINTLFLLDAGLSLTEAFVANAAFTAGMMIFEVPTGVIADSFGRRVSFILGASTLLLTTLAYLGLWYVEAGVGWGGLVSALIGLGFTFLSGATEAWLVDALRATGFRGSIETVFGRGQVAGGAATLVGTIAGGFLGQINLGIPYLLRCFLLMAVILAAWLWMHDLGFEPKRGGAIRPQVEEILRESIKHGFGNPPVRMFLYAAPFASGVGIWAFYAFQPYLLQLLKNPDATYLSG